MRKTTIKETMYGGGLHIVVCPEQEFIDFFNKKYREDDEVEGNLGQLFRSDKADKIYHVGAHTYLWMEKFDKNKQNDIDTLFHELEHYIIQELHRRQIRIHYENDEVWDESAAYFAGHVLSRVYKIIDKI